MRRSRATGWKVFPITFFAIAMGILGLTLAFHPAENAFGGGPAASLACLTVSMVIFLVFSCVCRMRYAVHRTAVEEWHRPVKIAFFAKISICAVQTGVEIFQSDATNKAENPVSGFLQHNHN